MRYDVFTLIFVLALSFTIWKLIEWIAKHTDIFHDRRRAARPVITVLAILLGASVFYFWLAYLFGLWMRS